MHATPRAYEPHRLVAAIRAQTRVLIAVGVVALFGGAAVGRLLVPDWQLARASARIAYEPHAVLSRANNEALLAEGRDDARVQVSFRGRDQLLVEVRAPQAARARVLADTMVDGYVALANARVEALRVRQRNAREAELARARFEREIAEASLHDVLVREGATDLERQELIARGQLAELDRAIQAATVSTPAPPSLDVQKAISRLLAQGAPASEIEAMRARMNVHAAPSARVRALTERSEAKRAELARLIALGEKLVPERDALSAAERRVAELAAKPQPDLHALQSAVTRVTSVTPLSRRALRVIPSLLAPVFAVLFTVLLLVVVELRDLRVREATELAHWLRVPVLTTSAWPRRNDALESLVDALADPALVSLGTTLVLPLSELERPLAYTLTKQLNTRAQRQFQSRTGSRVTIAQEWQGELDSTRIARAAEIADRVLWVVAADAHRGEVLASRRKLVAREAGVAAVLVDAEPVMVRSIGATQAFWTPREAAAQ